ncbi:MAG: outer membrane lipoprotein carrier protein LolA [Verrucomicrobiota bacterium]
MTTIRINLETREIEGTEAGRQHLSRRKLDCRQRVAGRTLSGLSRSGEKCGLARRAGRRIGSFITLATQPAKRIMTFVFVLFIGGQMIVRAANLNASVTAWLAAQANIQTWSANFTQTRMLKSLTQPLTGTGRVWFAAPNRFRWELGNPAQTIAVRQPDEMAVIYPRLKRIEKYPLTGAQNGPWKETLALLEAGFPRNQGELESRFRVLSADTTNGVCEIVMQPRAAGARRMMPQITVAFATNDFSLLATELRFADGSTMRNDFTNAVLNPKLDEALFTPKFGNDFQVIEPLKK